MEGPIFISSGGKKVRLDLAGLLFIEADRNYCRMHSVDGSRRLTTSIGELDTLLPSNAFCRVHRSYIVSLDKLEWFDHRELQLGPGDHRIPLGEAYRGVLQQRLTLLRAPQPTKRVKDA